MNNLCLTRTQPITANRGQVPRMLINHHLMKTHNNLMNSSTSINLSKQQQQQQQQQQLSTTIYYYPTSFEHYEAYLHFPSNRIVGS